MAQADQTGQKRDFLGLQRQPCGKARDHLENVLQRFSALTELIGASHRQIAGQRRMHHVTEINQPDGMLRLWSIDQNIVRIEVVMNDLCPQMWKLGRDFCIKVIKGCLLYTSDAADE